MIGDKNRAIAEALTAQGFDEALAWCYDKVCEDGHATLPNMWNECMEKIPDDSEGQTWRHCWKKVSIVRQPHDFTDPRYLFPALEAYCDKTGYGYFFHRYYDPSDGIDADIYGAGAHQFLDGHNTCWRGNCPHGKPFDALRDAFHAALTVEVPR